MIFQEPMTALNPVMRIGDQIAEGLLWHRKIGAAAARAEALRLLDRVRMPEAARRFAFYPHELSGGQRQRVGIAIALAPAQSSSSPTSPRPPSTSRSSPRFSTCSPSWWRSPPCP